MVLRKIRPGYYADKDGAWNVRAVKSPFLGWEMQWFEMDNEVGHRVKISLMVDSLRQARAHARRLKEV